MTPTAEQLLELSEWDCRNSQRTTVALKGERRIDVFEFQDRFWQVQYFIDEDGEPFDLGEPSEVFEHFVVRSRFYSKPPSYEVIDGPVTVHRETRVLVETQTEDSP